MGWDWQVRLIKLQIPAIKQRHIGEFNLTPVNMPSPILLHDIHTLLFIAQLWMPHRQQHQRKQAFPTDFHHFIISIGSNWSQKLVSAFEVGLLMLAFLKVMSTAKVNELFTAVDGTSLLLFTNGWRAVMWHETWPRLSMNPTLTYKGFTLSCSYSLWEFSGNFQWLLTSCSGWLSWLLCNSVHVEPFYMCIN